MRILLFDIDGTLIDTGGAGGSALRAALQSVFPIGEPGVVPFSGRTDRAIIRSLFALHQIDDSVENWQRLRDCYLEALPVHLQQKQGWVLNGVAELLGDLSERDDVRLGLLTGNLRDGARIKLEHFGLLETFAFGGFGDDLDDRDDVARMALDAARRDNGDHDVDGVWVVGDTPLDVRCARAIGARVLAVATGIHPDQELLAAKPDVLLDDLSETQRVLETLLS